MNYFRIGSFKKYNSTLNVKNVLFYSFFTYYKKSMMISQPIHDFWKMFSGSVMLKINWIMKTKTHFWMLCRYQTFFWIFWKSLGVKWNPKNAWFNFAPIPRQTREIKTQITVRALLQISKNLFLIAKNMMLNPIWKIWSSKFCLEVYSQ